MTASAVFNPVTMTEDEPEVAAKPFPKCWMGIIGLYVAAIVVVWCVGIDHKAFCNLSADCKFPVLAIFANCA